MRAQNSIIGSAIEKFAFTLTKVVDNILLKLISDDIKLIVKDKNNSDIKVLNHSSERYTHIFIHSSNVEYELVMLSRVILLVEFFLDPAESFTSRCFGNSVKKIFISVVI